MDGQWIAPGYQHVGTLGEGASGRVVRAEHVGTGTPVAIKYLSSRLLRDDAFLSRFRDEARLLAGLRDPNLVLFHEYLESPRGAAIVMELVNGVTLAALLRTEGPTGPEAALVVLKGSLLGLAAAHTAGVVHRDYKPGNVLVAGDGSSKLADFGVAVSAGEEVPAAGTPAYMAPEQWSGAPVGPATDVYAATAVFYECLTGERPYVAGTIPQLALAHQSADVPTDRVPEPLRGLVERGMAKDPRRRPASARDFLAELEAMATGAYGLGWEQRGRERLRDRAGLLALLFPESRPADTAGTSIGRTELDHGPEPSAGRLRGGRRRTAVTAAVIAACAALIGGGTATVFGGRSGSPTPLAKESNAPTPDSSGDPGAEPSFDPSAGPSGGPGSPTPSVFPTGTYSPGGGQGGGPGDGESPAPGSPAENPGSDPFQVTGVNVSVSRRIGSRAGSFTLTVPTKGGPTKPVTASIRIGSGLESDSPSRVTLRAPSYSATYSLASGCGPADTGWNWTVTAVADGKSGEGSTSGPYWPQDKSCG